MEATAHHLELVNVLRGGQGNYAMKVMHCVSVCHGLALLYDALSTATCDPPCENEGTCLTPNHCNCLQGFSGDHCERGLKFSQSISGYGGVTYGWLHFPEIPNCCSDYLDDV